jgi:molecular chaperone HtpG
VKLYVKRVFITDECPDLVPAWLRFLRGVVDSEDLPLNVSRETLQANPVVARIRQALVRRVLAELGRKAEKEPDEYAKFWGNFGAVLKEGLYEDAEHRDELTKIARFRSTASDPSTGSGLVGLDEYLGRMRPGQDAIYTITGDEIAALSKSPQLEGFAARGVEVLLLTDPVDEFWTMSLGAYKEKPFKSVTRAGAELAKIPLADAARSSEAAKADGKTDALIALFKLALKDAVKDVRASERLTESAVCLVADEGDPDIHLERLLKLHGRSEAKSKRILEINPGHALIRALAERVGKDGAGGAVDDAAWLLLDQARILEGEPLPDPAAFSRRLASAMEKGLS